ncbi:MAG: UDP-N-acetylmuramoyl-tripeptide--D-alanyl-D-alanine ligase [Clostridia bacterium]|nr:UDP-N-acetylmuramoyl-tripeptide--D-alanyl-D-alanine ligase [Clostridia bacterium]
MIDVMIRIGSSIVCACFLCATTIGMVGAMQQGGYKNDAFFRWLKRKDNLFFNRLSVLSLCLFLATAITALCFSFLGVQIALIISAVPYMTLLFVFHFSGKKYALKVPAVRTGRYCRLSGVYAFLVLCVSYAAIALLEFLSVWIDTELYSLLAYTPFAAMPLVLPFLLCLANALESVYERIRNGKFVERMGQVLDEKEMIRVGVVGSYGKTSVKNILATILSTHYDVIATAESYNTPIGIAKTVALPEFEKKQVFIAEMGARKAGDIQELCEMVKPDYAVFTGVCEQHIFTFGDLDSVWAEKSVILRCGTKKTVCGTGLKTRMDSLSEDVKSRCILIDDATVKNVRLGAKSTEFTVVLGVEELDVKTPLLGRAAVENITLAVTLAKEMGLTVEEIEKGLKTITPIPHRLQLLESDGVYILDDGYNCNPVGAKEAIEALGRFEGRKCIVTPGIVECGILEETINGVLGEEIARAKFDKVILVGDTLVGAVKDGYVTAGGEIDALASAQTLEDVKGLLAEWTKKGDAVLFLNDLPDVY